MAKTLVINITGLSIHLDEKSIEYTFEETWYAWIVHLVYSHSTHKVTIFLSAPPPENTIATSTSSSETLVILLIGLLVCKCLGKKLRKPQLT
jgi:hypothetical protein